VITSRIIGCLFEPPGVVAFGNSRPWTELENTRGFRRDREVLWRHQGAGGASLSVVLVGEMLRFLHFYVIANSTESSNSTCSAIQSGVAETSRAHSDQSEKSPRFRGVLAVEPSRTRTGDGEFGASAGQECRLLGRPVFRIRPASSRTAANRR
jgi:hypothetical protein